MKKKDENALSPSSEEASALFMSLQINSSGTKFFIIAASILVVALVLWLFLGTIPIKISGYGLITQKGQGTTIVITYPAIVTEILVKEGDTIRKGSRLLQLYNLDLSQSVDNQLLELKNKHKEDSLLAYSLEQANKELDANYALEYNQIKMQITSNSEQTEYYERLRKTNEELLTKGIITEAELKQVQFNLEQKQIEGKNLNEKLQSIKFNHDNELRQNLSRMTETSDRTLLLQEEIDNLIEKEREYTYLIADEDIVIMEVLIKKNEAITANVKVFTVAELESDQLYADIFVPYSDKGKTMPGMEAVLEPFNTDASRFGQIESKLTHVNSFTASKEFLGNLLADASEIELFLSNGPVYYCKAILLTDSATQSGLKWTSKKGPSYKIDPGTICNVEIYTEEVSPFDLIVPTIKEALRYE
ncbi:MAG: hypothetical protein LBO69_04870 [Ignavibacteria bacterium]|jgi:NHLM bacteriocin system secretion protein|nr:hypothetical protein [Ignavibacteria bacterium]